MFETAKAYFNIVALALGGAGAAIAWTAIPSNVQKISVMIFLSATIVLSALAVLALKSQKAYLRGFYSVRKELEASEQTKGNVHLELYKKQGGSGYTMVSLWGGFSWRLQLLFLLLLLLPNATRIPLLQGANLTGADLAHHSPDLAAGT